MKSCERGKKILAALLVLGTVFFSKKLQAEENMSSFQELDGWLSRAQLLEETKRVRRLELEILELEQKAREKKDALDGRKVEERKKSEAQPLGQSGKREPLIHAIEGTGKRRFVILTSPSGRRVRLGPGEKMGEFTVVAISRDAVLVRRQGRVMALDFERKWGR